MSQLQTDTETWMREIEGQMITIIAATSGAHTERSASLAVEAALYHLKTGGSRTRARICMEMSMTLRLTKFDAIALSACVELLHNASLIHDDLQDLEKTRHQEKSVWTKYSPSIAVCAGDLMISCAYVAISAVSNPQILPDLLNAVHRCIANATRGQCKDLTVRSPNDLSLDEYVDIVKAKSGALLALPLELPLLLMGDRKASKLAIEAAEDFSVGYQIIDDLVDLEDDLGNRERPASLNISTLIKQNGRKGSPKEEMKVLARSYFESAHRIAGELPGSSGLYLQSLSKKIVQAL